MAMMHKPTPKITPFPPHTSVNNVFLRLVKIQIDKSKGGAMYKTMKI